ncbi:MAG: DUF2946 family protein [Burkholderiales bacterium]|nr:DUF2946 family protein [Burkholderiales bacterium]
MDDIVKQAIAKWPNVPHCYGWLALDARGNWRMRDERAQALKLAGDRITNPALLGFINRNYLHDERGCWYFQNGPQRVYVALEATPYIARTEPDHRFILHTGEALSTLDHAWLTESGALILQSGEKIAMVDDRDMAQCMTQLQLGECTVCDDELLDWMAGADNIQPLVLRYNEQSLAVGRIALEALASHFRFVREPSPEVTRSPN